MYTKSTNPDLEIRTCISRVDKKLSSKERDAFLQSWSRTESDASCLFYVTTGKLISICRSLMQRPERRVSWSADGRRIVVVCCNFEEFMSDYGFAMGRDGFWEKVVCINNG